MFEEAHQHRRLAELQALDQAGVADLDQAVLQGFVHRLRRDVAPAAVVESHPGGELNAVAVRFQDRRGGRHLEPRHRPLPGAGARQAGGDPVPQNPVLPAVRIEALAPLVGQLVAALGEDQAARGLEQVDPPAGDVAAERGVVEVGILAAQRQLEAAFAGGVAMAGAQVAAGLGKRRHDVGAERRLRSRRQPAQGEQEGKAETTASGGHGRQKSTAPAGRFLRTGGAKESSRVRATVASPAKFRPSGSEPAQAR